MTQAQLGRRVGMSQPRISAVERGTGVGLPIGIWVGLGIALRRPLSIAFSRGIDPVDALADAGHLEIQEYLLDVGRRNGRKGSFEVPTHPSDPSFSIDVHELDLKHACLIILEAWNRFADLGAAARSSDRKVAMTIASAAASGGPLVVRHCWVVRDSAANRSLVRRYPAILAARFPGSSARWVAALERGDAPPLEPGIVWFDPARRRLRPMRIARR
jgi:transcriptional regulator with XRE-family HTH domain